MNQEYITELYITKENRLYLKCIEAISNIHNSTVNAEEPYEIIKDFIRKNKLDGNRLREYAEKYSERDIGKDIDLCVGKGEKARKIEMED